MRRLSVLMLLIVSVLLAGATGQCTTFTNATTAGTGGVSVTGTGTTMTTGGGLIY